MIIKDQFENQVSMHFTEPNDKADGAHVLSIPLYNGQFVLTKHKRRGIEFPGGKIEQGESSAEAVIRELFEETGAKAREITYIAQYTIYRPDGEFWFTKDVYAVDVKEMINKTDYLETDGPKLVQSLDEIREEDKSYLLKDAIILKCAERVKELGLYQ